MGQNYQQLVKDPETGFLESPVNYITAFDAERKTQFLEILKTNGLRIKAAAKTLGVAFQTIQKHFSEDPSFREAVKAVEQEVADDIQAKSINVALTDKGFMDRAMQLRRLRPNEYLPEKQGQIGNVTITIQGDLVIDSKKRAEMIDAEIVQEVERARLGQRENVESLESASIMAEVLPISANNTKYTKSVDNHKDSI